MLSRRALLVHAGRLSAGVGLAQLVLAAPARAGGGLPRNRLGAYSGCVDADAAGSLERLLGRRLRFVHDFVPTGEDWARCHSQPYAFEQNWTAPGSAYADRLYLSVPLLVGRDTTHADGRGRATTLAAAAGGRYDHHYRALARQLVAAGLGGARLRIGWEMNTMPGPAADGGGDWSAGATRTGERDFALAFRRMVTAMRSVPGARFRYVWCPAIGSSWSPVLGRPIDAARCYPGDAYVDIIACDVYDRSWHRNSDATTRWRDIKTDRLGNEFCLDWFERFARRRHRRPNNDGSSRVGPGHGAPGATRPLGLAEFGTFRRHGERPGQRDGGDNPYFLERLTEWIVSIGPDRWDHLLYWNYGTGRLGPAHRRPRWSSTMRRLFGSARRRA